MEIQLGNIHSGVIDASDLENTWLDDFLSWPDDKAWMMKRMGYRVPGHIHLYDKNGVAEVPFSFPAGFTRMVVKGARAAGFEVLVHDARVKPTAALLPLPAYLRDYQVEACESAIKRTRGVVWAATGAGKTQIAMGLVERVPARWLFLVNLTQLGLQARDRYRTFCGMEAGVIAEGKWTEDHNPHSLTVATFQTLHARLRKDASDPDRKAAVKFLSKIEGVIVDECHVLPADSFRRVVDTLPNAFYRLGLSATPLQRGDKKAMHLIGCLGSVVYRIGAQVLIKAGILAKPNIKMVPHFEESEKKTWQGVYNDLIVKSKSRNRLVVDLAVQAVKPCIVFVKQLNHGHAILKALTKRGVTAEYIDGGSPTPVRQAAVTRLERGDTDVMIATVVMNQGIDIPNLASMVMAAGGASSIEALQRVGRGMRTDNGKKATVDIWDIMDTGNKWTERHAEARIKAYGVEEYEPEVLDVDPTLPPAQVAV